MLVLLYIILSCNYTHIFVKLVVCYYPVKLTQLHICTIYLYFRRISRTSTFLRNSLKSLEVWNYYKESFNFFCTGYLRKFLFFFYIFFLLIHIFTTTYVEFVWKKNQPNNEANLWNNMKRRKKCRILEIWELHFYVFFLERFMDFS